MPFKDFYAILGLTAGEITVAELKSAYKKEALKVHPDRNLGDPTATATFQALGIALDILEDPTKHARYRVRYAEYIRHRDQLAPLLVRRGALIKESAELQELWDRVCRYDFPRWGEWEDYVQYGGGNGEIARDICVVLRRRMDKNRLELGAVWGPIAQIQERIDKLPMQ